MEKWGKKNPSVETFKRKIKIAEGIHRGGRITVDGQWIESCPRSFRRKEGS